MPVVVDTCASARHRLPFLVDALPAAVYNAVAGRGSRPDPLLECLMRHQLLLEPSHSEPVRVAAGRQPPVTKSVNQEMGTPIG
jgi:hypothetical protein